MKGAVMSGQLEEKVAALEATVAELTTRLRVVEDENEIKRLQRRYVDALMATEWDVAVDCFAEDGIVDVYMHEPRHGKAAVEQWFKEVLVKTHAGYEGDIVTHPIISIDGDRANGSWLLYMMYFYPRTGQSLFWVQGYYDMDYVRENGVWKIAVMRWSERIGLPGGGPPTGLW